MLEQVVEVSRWYLWLVFFRLKKAITMVSTLPGERQISFPEDRSLGELYIVDKDGRSEFLCEAKGLVCVPANRLVSLSYSFDPNFGLSALRLLKADDLTGLSFLGSDLRDDELLCLTTLTGLKELELSCTTISDQGLKHLAGLCGLTKLSLASTKISDAGLVHLAGMKALRELVLDDTRVSDEGMVHLAPLTALTTLSLSFTGISSKGLAKLRGLTALERLRLNCTRIDDQGLSHVQRLASLRELWVRGTDVTYPGLVELTKWLADCEIIR